MVPSGGIHTLTTLSPGMQAAPSDSLLTEYEKYDAMSLPRLSPKNVVSHLLTLSCLSCSEGGEPPCCKLPREDDPGARN